MSGELSPSEERDMEAWNRAEAAAANYDPADREGYEDGLAYECEVCGRPVNFKGSWCPRCRREQDRIEERTGR